MFAGLVLIFTVVGRGVSSEETDSTPAGYYMFDVAPFKTPPKVRKPPYIQTNQVCPGLNAPLDERRLRENLCGDLQTGQIPINPVQRTLFDGQAYPFEIIRNASLDFFGSTLPILKEDPTLPKVAKFQRQNKIKRHPGTVSLFETLSRGRRAAVEKSAASRRLADQTRPQRRSPDAPSSVRKSPEPSAPTRRSSETLSAPRRVLDGAPSGQANVKGHIKHADEGKEHDPGRNSRGFCDTNWGVFCALFSGWSGSPDSEAEVSHQRSDSDAAPVPPAEGDSGDGPLTPCPSSVDYVTPVFARNYEGVWRYVVQIPHAGYFTQTIEVTSCRSSRCHLMEGACLSSPRWLSLLVAEMFYPHETFPLPPAVTRAPVSAPPPPTDTVPTDSNTQLSERVGEVAERAEEDPEYCDGRDQIGCFQVRLYYDWFLVPGSCKCWKHDVFARYRAGSRMPKSSNP